MGRITDTLPIDGFEVVIEVELGLDAQLRAVPYRSMAGRILLCDIEVVIRVKVTNASDPLTYEITGIEIEEDRVAPEGDLYEVWLDYLTDQGPDGAAEIVDEAVEKDFVEHLVDAA